MTTPNGRRVSYIALACVCIYCTWRLHALRTKNYENDSPRQVALRRMLFAALGCWLAVGLLHNFHWFQTVTSF